MTKTVYHLTQLSIDMVESIPHIDDQEMFISICKKGLGMKIWELNWLQAWFDEAPHYSDLFNIQIIES